MMLPDLGKYAFEVTLAYGVSLALMAALVMFVVRKASRAKAELSELEATLRNRMER